MIANGYLQLAFYIVVLIALAKPVERRLGVERKGDEQERQAQRGGQRARRIGEPLRSSHRRVK